MTVSSTNNDIEAKIETMLQEVDTMVQEAEHPQEKLIDVMMALQNIYGYLSDTAVQKAAQMFNTDPVKIEELATFYNYIYREPVGKYVIHVCDSVICHVNGYIKIRDYLCQKLEIEMGQTTPDRLFTLLPSCCIGYCDHSPAMLVNKKVYGHLTPERIDELIDQLRKDA